MNFKFNTILRLLKSLSIKMVYVLLDSFRYVRRVNCKYIRSFKKVKFVVQFILAVGVVNTKVRQTCCYY